jgi:hypothetical protein
MWFVERRTKVSLQNGRKKQATRDTSDGYKDILTRKPGKHRRRTAQNPWRLVQKTIEVKLTRSFLGPAPDTPTTYGTDLTTKETLNKNEQGESQQRVVI